MNIQKIKSYGDLNNDEQYVVNNYMEMRIELDKTKIEFMLYQLANLDNKYDELQQLRNEIRENYFSILKKIDEFGCAEIDIDYERWDNVLSTEVAEWDEEMELMGNIKYFLESLMKQLSDGSIEQLIIDGGK